MALGCLACGSETLAPPRVVFDGQPSSRALPGCSVGEQEAAGPGDRILGRVTAQCTRSAPKGAFEGVALGNLECGSVLLERLLREQSLAVGAQLLVKKRCYRRELVDSGEPPNELFVCWADAVTSGREPQVSPGGSPAPCPRSETDRSLMEVGFVPVEPGRIPTDPWPEVTEVPVVSVAQRFIGDLSVRCKEPCSTANLEVGVARAARVLGATHFTSPSCTRRREGDLVVAQCHSQLGVPRVDPRVDPRAR